MKRPNILIVLLFAFILNSQVFTHPAFARSSGGGKLAEFDEGKFVTGVAIGLASTFVGGAIADGIGASANGGSFFTGVDGVGGFSGTMAKIGNIGTWASNYNTMTALSQVGAAVNTMGQYKGWDTSKTVLISSIAQGMTGGFLNPSSTLGVGATSNATIKAVGVGAISGVAEGAILAANVDSSGKIKPWVSASAGLAGSFVGGVASASMATVVPEKGIKVGQTPNPSYEDFVKSGNPAIPSVVSKTGYNQIAANNTVKINLGFGQKSISLGARNKALPTMVKTYTPVTTYHKANNFGQALTHGAVRAFSAIPSYAISMGVNNITKDMDRQDAFMARQAFRGVYPIAGVVYQNEFRDPALEKLGLDHYVGQNGLMGTELQKIGRPPTIVPTQTYDTGADITGDTGL